MSRNSLKNGGGAVVREARRERRARERIEKREAKKAAKRAFAALRRG